MKYLVIFLVLLGFISCDNELNVIEDFKDIPVVYGVISSSDSAQYIRVERAFVDPNTSALELAKIADSLYYQNAEVRIINSSGIEYNLSRVNGEDEGYPRESGAFAETPNYLYKIKTSDINLTAGEEYTLSLNRSENLETVTARTKLVGESTILTPSSSIGFAYVQPTKIRWRKGAQARVFDIYIQVNYRERVTVSSNDFEKKSVSWQMASNISSSGDNVENFEMPGVDFYSFLIGAIEINPELERRFDDITLTLVSGGSEILELNRLSEANLGITSSQDIPVFTNLSEGRGIFSSKYTERLTGLELKNSSLDSLTDGIITRDLNFKR